MVKIFDVVKEGATILEGISDTPQLDSEVLLSHLLNKDRMYLYLNRLETLNEDIYSEFKKLIEKRKTYMPISYIVGEREFMGLPFKVCPGVLIPRGDTEILVEKLIDECKKIESPFIVDVGCGSGAIGVSLASYIKDSQVVALDIMDIPLKVANENAALNEVDNRYIAKKSDMLSVLDETYIENVDVIVSNPPYIREDVIPTLMKDVKDFEPMTALSGGEDGLYFYRNITMDSVKFLKPNGILAYEIGYDQGEDVKNLLIENGFYNVEIINDLAGLNRVIIGYKKKM